MFMLVENRGRIMKITGLTSKMKAGGLKTQQNDQLLNYFKYQLRENSMKLTMALISHASKLMLKILQARLQQYMNCELPDVQAGFRKGRGSLGATGILGLHTRLTRGIRPRLEGKQRTPLSF